MPRGAKVKIQWITKAAQRQASFRKRRDTLIQKARELSILCSVPAAVVVYGKGEAEPTFWPEGVEEVREILQRYRDLPDSSKEAHRLDNEGFMRQRREKMRRKVDNYKASVRELEVNLVLNDVALGRRREFDDLPRELVSSVASALDALRSITADRVNLLRSGVAQPVALAPPVHDEGAALQEPLMVPPLVRAAPVVAMANAPPVQTAPPQSVLVVAPPPQEEPTMMVPPLAMAPVAADALLLLPAPELEPELAPGQSEVVLVAPAPQEPPMVADASLLLPAVEPAPLLPEIPVIPPEVAEFLLQLLAPEAEPEPELAPTPPPQEPLIIEVEDAPLQAPVPEPQVTAAVVDLEDDEPLNLDFEPRNGSFLLEVADAIMDDGTGHLATDEDVDRLLREHGLEHLKPKPK